MQGKILLSICDSVNDRTVVNMGDLNNAKSYDKHESIKSVEFYSKAEFQGKYLTVKGPYVYNLIDGSEKNRNQRAIYDFIQTGDGVRSIKLNK